MNLYIDIGNTNIKFLFEDKVFRFKTKNNYSSLEIKSELKEHIDFDLITNVYASNVVPPYRETLNSFAKSINREINWLEFPIKTGIKIESDNPKKVGSDLVALAAFAKSQCDNSIIVNMGTATTITHVKDGALKGVTISLGLERQFASLSSGASQLSDINIEWIDKVVGKNTDDAINIGVLKGHAYMIMGLVSKMDPEAKVILSGGNSIWLKDHLPYEYVEEATLKGLKIIGEYNDN